jgi:hypothetical protein
MCVTRVALIVVAFATTYQGCTGHPVPRCFAALQRTGRSLCVTTEIGLYHHSKPRQGCCPCGEAKCLAYSL